MHLGTQESQNVGAGKIYLLRSWSNRHKEGEVWEVQQFSHILGDRTRVNLDPPTLISVFSLQLSITFEICGFQIFSFVEEPFPQTNSNKFKT